MDHKKKRAWFGYSMAIIFLMMGMGIPSSFGAAAKGGTAPPNLPQSYKSVEELYAALAKLPFDQRQEAILAGAKKEGKVVLYVTADEANLNPVFKGFEQRYPGMKVEYFRALAEETVAKALTEVRADRWYWDSVEVGPGYGDLKKENALARHYNLFPRGNFPKAFMGDDWFGTNLNPMIIAYNTNMLKANEAPKSYKELLDPKWKGKVSIDSSPDNLLTAMLKKWGRAKTEDWLDKFVNGNNALIRKGHTAQVKLLIAGEFPVASEVYGYQTEYQKQSQGAPIDWVLPEDLCEGEVATAAISRKAPHPYATILWMQYFISKEGQQIYAQKGRIPVNPEAEVQYPKMKLFLTNLDRLTVINSSGDAKLFTEANDLIKKYIAPRLRGN